MSEFHTARESFVYQLGSALRTERTALEIFQMSSRAVREDAVIDLIERLRDGVDQRITRLERVFRELRETAIESPSSGMHGIKKGIHENSKRMGKGVADLVLLQGVTEAGYYQLGVYVNLKVCAQALRRRRIAATMDASVSDLREDLGESVALQARLASPATPGSRRSSAR